MTLVEVRHALNRGLVVCWCTSRYECFINASGELVERDVYNGTGSNLTEESAKQCFIKADGAS